MSILRSFGRKFGTRSTQLVGMFWGESFPFYYVSEYPRSGGTWLSHMIADYLDIPKPHHSIFPMGCSCVVHNHWGYSPRLRRVFYLTRDGRDVCVSTYHFCLRGLRSNKAEVRQYFAGRIRDAEQVSDWSHERCAELMPHFIENWARKPLGCRINWNDHIAQWNQSKHAVHLKYEDLLNNCHQTLRVAIEQHTGKAVDDDRLARTIDKYSFENQSGRKPGQEDTGSFMRKGIAGDWKNYFDRRSAEVFDRLFGKTLVKLGYERDSEWVKSVPEALPAAEANTEHAVETRS